MEKDYNEIGHHGNAKSLGDLLTLGVQIYEAAGFGRSCS
jgi:hypothetical protein